MIEKVFDNFHDLYFEALEMGIVSIDFIDQEAIASFFNKNAEPGVIFLIENAANIEEFVYRSHLDEKYQDTDPDDFGQFLTTTHFAQYLNDKKEQSAAQLAKKKKTAEELRKEKLERWGLSEQTVPKQEVEPAAPVHEENKSSKSNLPDHSLTIQSLFKNQDHFNQCLQLLKDAEVVSDDGVFIGKNKGVLVVWVNALISKGLISVISDVQKVQVLMKAIPGFTISKDSFSSKNVRAKDEFKSYFEAEFAAIKTNKD